MTASAVCADHLRRFVDQLGKRQAALIVGLHPPQGHSHDSKVTSRLAELGFLPGELVTVLHRGPGGREPLAVQVGDSVFALRALEAACIEVHHGSIAPAP
ncbi:FeoA family protein [Rhodoferax sp.]|uniref:FeoA family protein n=1 Tax=Rhodoferax sp. TaxID=50421 RepID=UPI00276AC84F|nr:FeoA family protein [Rhodoferax sp.]